MNETEDTLARLREQADRGFPTAWIPDDPGQELVGVVVGIKPAVRTSYGHVPVLEVEELRTRTPWSVWLVHVVLRRAVWRARPGVGETILIRYDGRVHPEGGGAPYEMYRVIVDRPDEGNEVDWQAIARRYDPDTLDHDHEAPPSPTTSTTSTQDGPEAADEIPY